jgi:serine/threonine protein kinase
MGEVYCATDTRLARTVAIKILPASVADTPARRRRWEREARAISALNHPNICALYDVGEEQGVPFIVMEHLAGETLAEQLARGPLSVPDALRHATAIADALSHAHRLGIIHRDLKPGNIMITRSGAKLLDFGLAALQSTDANDSGARESMTRTETLTEEGTILGTIHYMAPEQLEAKAVDARADIFAFGAVLYEMLTGRRPFDGTSKASVIAAVLEREPRPLSVVRQGHAAGSMTPPLLEQIVTRCLAKNPESRWQTARDLHAALEWANRAAPSSTQAAPVAPARRLPFMWIATAAIAGAIVAAVAPGVWTDRAGSDAETPSFQFTVPPPDGMAFNAANSFMSLSPDGRTLAFCASTARATSALWVQSLDDLKPRQLPGTDRAIQIFWSADSRSIAFSAEDKLKTIEVATGRVQTIGPAGMVGAWSPEGVILTRKQFIGPEGAILWRVPAGGGEMRPASTLGRLAGAPAFLPDGRRFLFVSPKPDAEATQRMIHAGSLDSLESTPLFESDSQAVYAAGHVLYMRGSTLVAQRFDLERLSLSGDPMPIAAQVDRVAGVPHAAFSVSHAGVLAYRSARETELVWFDRAGKRLGAVGRPAHYGNPALSPDGRRVAVDRVDPSSAQPAIWMIDLASEAETRIAGGSTAARMPLWTADGRQVVYRGGPAFYFSRKSIAGDDREETLISGLTTLATPLGWTNDARALLFDDISAASALDLHLLSLDGERTRRAWLQSKSGESQGQLSPDGQWLAYVLNESGKNEICVRPFPSGDAKWCLAPDGGLEPRWRPDGRELFYLAPDRSLMAVGIRTTPSFKAEQPVRLFPTRMSTFQNGSFTRNQYVIAADGRILINQPVESNAPITVITNWMARLPRR